MTYPGPASSTAGNGEVAVAVVDADQTTRSRLAMQLGQGATPFAAIDDLAGRLTGSPVVVVLGPTYQDPSALGRVEKLLADRREVGAILVWGDPSLYDSTLRVLERIRAAGRLDLACAVVPGITSVQALTAAHRILLNRIGADVLITTGRNLAAQGLVADSTVVMLDGEPAFDRLDPELTIYWGAYLGSPDEILVSGRLGTVAPEIRRRRAEASATPFQPSL